MTQKKYEVVVELTLKRSVSNERAAAMVYGLINASSAHYRDDVLHWETKPLHKETSNGPTKVHDR